MSNKIETDPLAVRCEAYAWSLLVSQIAGSSLAQDMDVLLLSMFYVV
jgi:hypothetical protein